MSEQLTFEQAMSRLEQIVVKLESGVLKLYDKYHKPIKE